MRRLLLRDIDEWTLDDVRELIASRLPEGQRIEYKAELHLDTSAQRAELAKDISGMANAQGGVILFGVAEDHSAEPLPTDITPLPAAGLQTIAENIIDDTVVPTPDYKLRTIAIDDGVVLVAKIGPRRGRPHMVQGYRQFRYFIRSGTRTRPMSETEVSDAYAAAATGEDRLHGRLRGLPLCARINRPPSVDVLKIAADREPEPQWLPLACVIVAALDAPDELIGPRWMERRAFEENFTRNRGRHQARSLFNFDITAHGLIEEETHPDDDRAVLRRVAVYRAGVVEWARRYRDLVIPSKTLADDVFNALRYAASVFETVGYVGRLAIWVRIENAERAQLGVANDWDLHWREPRVEWIGGSTERSVDDLLDDPTPVVRETMDRIWQGFGVQRCLLFDEQGSWTY